MLARQPQGGSLLAAESQRNVMTETELNHIEPTEARWLVWGRSVFAVTVVALLIALGIANVAMYSRWHEVEDGALWSARAEGVTATEVANAAMCCSPSTARRCRRRLMSSSISTVVTPAPTSLTPFSGLECGSRWN